MSAVNSNVNCVTASNDSSLTSLASTASGVISGVWSYAKSCFTENAVRRDVLNRLDAKLADPNEAPVAKLYYRDLKSKITSTSKTQDPTALCQSFEQTSQQYKNLVARVEQVVSPALSRNEADTLYKGALDELKALEKSPITETERVIYTGRIVKAFRDLDNAYATASGQPLHRYCGCHVLEQGKDEAERKFSVRYPTTLAPDADLNGRAALEQSWSLGGGHNVAQRGMTQRIAEAGMHSYHVEADVETLRPFDALRNLTKDKYSDADLLRSLMKNNCWKTLRFINWAFSGKPSAEKYQATMDSFTRTILARGAPDLQMSIYARNAGAAANAAGQLGAAAINIHTDLLADLYDIERPSDVQNPHFADALMVAGDKIQAPARKALNPEQIHVTGFPVRAAFLKNYDLNALRAQHNIDQDARVVVLCSGGEGVENGYAEYIVNQYKNREDLPKIHLVVICGRNDTKERKLKKEFASLNNPNMRVTVKGWTKEDEMAQYNALAGDPNRHGALISTKGGGGTLSEGLASGTPMLLGSSDDIEWEKANIDYVCENGCGLRFKGEPDVLDRLEELFRMPYTRVQHNSKAASMNLVRNQIHAAEQDGVFVAKRAAALQFTPPTLNHLRSV